LIIRSACFPNSALFFMLLPALAASLSTAGAADLQLKAVYARPNRSARMADHSNIVVWLTPLSEPALAQSEKAMQLIPRHYRLLQKKKEFIPHLLVIPAGSLVDFPNQDPFFHNVFSLFDGRRFDLGLYEAGATRGVRFDRAGVSFVFCNIHPQMSAIVITLKTPFSGITDRAGNITLQEIPPGRYSLEVWAERSLPNSLQALTRVVTVLDASNSLVSIEVPENADLLSGHKNKYGKDYEPTTTGNPGYLRPD